MISGGCLSCLSFEPVPSYIVSHVSSLDDEERMGQELEVSTLGWQTLRLKHRSTLEPAVQRASGFADMVSLF